MDIDELIKEVSYPINAFINLNPVARLHSSSYSIEITAYRVQGQVGCKADLKLRPLATPWTLERMIGLHASARGLAGSAIKNLVVTCHPAKRFWEVNGFRYYTMPGIDTLHAWADLHDVDIKLSYTASVSTEISTEHRVCITSRVGMS